MKKLISLFIAFLLISCASQKKYTEFDISYSRSGGLAPIYENLLIKGTKAHYSLEGQGKNIKKDFVVSNEEIQQIHSVLTKNHFSKIKEDLKKQYDFIATTINVKDGSNSGIVSDASGVREAHQENWDNITNFFQDFIEKKKLNQ